MNTDAILNFPHDEYNLVIADNRAKVIVLKALIRLYVNHDHHVAVESASNAINKLEQYSHVLSKRCAIAHSMRVFIFKHRYKPKYVVFAMKEFERFACLSKKIDEQVILASKDACGLFEEHITEFSKLNESLLINFTINKNNGTTATATATATATGTIAHNGGGTGS